VASIGYFIGDKDYWGKGVATETISIILDLAKNKYNLAKVTAELYEPNIASEKTLLKNGFVLEGVLQSNAVLEGQRINSKIFGHVL
jgi:ribosomal-protein-alanine N-acetyltransferase